MTGRPSQELMATADKVGMEEDLARHHFAQTMPSAITPVLAAARNLISNELGILADELLPFRKTIVQNTTSECYKRQPLRTKKPNTEMHTGLLSFYGNQRPQVCCRHLYFGKKSQTCKPWCQWSDKADCKIQPNSRSTSPARGSMPNK